MSPATFSDPFAPVEIQPITVAGEKVATRVAVRVKGDDGAFSVQGLVGADYQLLPNRKVRDLAEDIMSRCPADYGGFRNLKTLFNGKHYVDYFASNNPIARATNGTVTELNLGLMVWNAYDGTRKVGFEIFALNPFCTNQYHSRNRFGFFAWRHQPGQGGKIDMDDALQGITTGARNLIAIAPAIGELKHRELDHQMIVSARKDTDLPTTRWGDVLDQLGSEDPTAFGLFQAMTNVASHKLTGMSAINTGTSIAEHFFNMVGAKPAEAFNHTTAEAVVNAAERAA